MFRLSPVIFLFLLLSCSNQKKVDLVIKNATVYTVNEQFGKAEAFAVSEGKIVAVGTNKEIENAYTAKQFFCARVSHLT